MGEAIEAVERAVLRLKDIERQVIVKHYVSWEPVEISAQKCEMSVNRFRVILCRARRKIGDYLAKLATDGLIS
jgi:DNA-directed RNA polymerase specialized sigma24 family protein